MSREDGFVNADFDTRYFDDLKVKRLFREYADLAALAVCAHVGIIAHCWQCGERQTALDAWPPIVPYSEPALAALMDVGLLDRSARLPVKAWKDRYGLAFERRMLRRMAGARGGKQKSSNARAGLEHGLPENLPGPSVPDLPAESTPQPPRRGARQNKTNLRSKGHAPRQVQAANEAELMRRFKETGGVRSMPNGLKDEAR